MFMSVFCGIAD